MALDPNWQASKGGRKIKREREREGGRLGSICSNGGERLRSVIVDAPGLQFYKEWRQKTHLYSHPNKLII